MLKEWTARYPAIGELLAALLGENSPVYVVGGVVRDILMNQQPQLNDLDIVIEGPALAQSKRVADRLGWAYYPLDEARDVARIVFMASSDQPLMCDIAGLRGAQIEGDLLARDFTVNAMALAIYADGSTELIDVTNGREDLDNLVLRRVSAWGLADDAVRLLRAVRLIAQFGFTLEEETRRQVSRLARTIRLVSPERVRDELWKMLATQFPARALSELEELGLLGHVLPELADTLGIEQSSPHYQDVFEHTMRDNRRMPLLA